MALKCFRQENSQQYSRVVLLKKKQLRKATQRTKLVSLKRIGQADSQQSRVWFAIIAYERKQVYKATRTSDGKLVALKCIKQEDGDGKGFPVTALREMRILRQLRHKVSNHYPRAIQRAYQLQSTVYLVVRTITRSPG